MKSYQEIIGSLRASGNIRRIPAHMDSRQGVIDFSLNDYLGLASDLSLQEEFFDSPENRAIPMTSSASRLLASSQRAYESLETLLSHLYGRAVLLFNSGYHLNSGLIPALAEGKTLILADRLVHASMIDGMMLSGCRFLRFRHNDPAHLERLLRENEGTFDRVLILVESVYSMDGDVAPLEEIACIRRSCPKAILYVDEAHAFGVAGKHGLGLCRGAGFYGDVDVVVGTFGKACASMGAFCAVSDEVIRDLAVNRTRSLIFSTALPPMTAAWTEFILRRMVGMDEARQRLYTLGTMLAGDDGADGIRMGVPHHIFPFIVGDSAKAVALSARLLEEGMRVLPIRTPTVPPGTERLRISLSAAMNPADVSRLRAALSRLAAE